MFANLIHFLTALIKPYQVIIQNIYVKAIAQNLDQLIGVWVCFLTYYL